MNVGIWSALEASGYALAMVFAIAAAVVFFTKHVREVRDEMTGRTAKRAIEEMRSGGGGIFRAVASMRFADGGHAERGDESGRFPGRAERVRRTRARTSGSLRVRFSKDSVDAEKTARVEGRMRDVASEAGTTLLAADAAEERARKDASEAGTTLLAHDVGEQGALEQGALEQGAAEQRAAAGTEDGTTLFSPQAAASDSEAGTTLLGKERA